MGGLGIISDTHGLLREAALALLHGSELIIHAGDVGDPAILDELSRLAPLVAIQGNIDRQPWASVLPATAVVETAGGLIYVLHDLHELDLNPVSAGFAGVISGHSHKPSATLQHGVYYVNPGSAGPRRFNLPVTVARIDPSQTPWTVKFIDVLTGSVSDGY